MVALGQSEARWPHREPSPAHSVRVRVPEAEAPVGRSQGQPPVDAPPDRMGLAKEEVGGRWGRGWPGGRRERHDLGTEAFGSRAASARDTRACTAGVAQLIVDSSGPGVLDTFGAG